MPTLVAEPTIAELLQAFEDGVRSKDRYADVREGAIYQHFGGAAAILWSRLAQRDTDLWRAIYLDSAESKDLTKLLNDRYDFARVEDSYGVGTARLKRVTATAGAGTVWAGTRIAVTGDAQIARRYVVTADTEVGASELSVIVPVRADRVGAGVAISTALGLRVDDPLWDTTWTVDQLTCADGTAFEQASEARARFRESRLAARAGFVEAIVQACKDAGATYALLFPSDYAGDQYDVGLNMAYVGDDGYSGSDALVRAVSVALERWRVLGDNLQVRPLGRANLTIQAGVNLWDSPARVNQAEVQRLLKGSLRGYFGGGDAGFSYDRDAMAGAMLRVSPDVQFVTFDTPSSDAAVTATVGGLPNFPATLTRYVVRDEDITLTLLPPS